MNVKSEIDRHYEIPYEDVVKHLGRLVSKGTISEDTLKEGSINLDASGDFFSLTFTSTTQEWVEEEAA